MIVDKACASVHLQLPFLESWSQVKSEAFIYLRASPAHASHRKVRFRGEESWSEEAERDGCAAAPLQASHKELSLNPFI